MVFENKSEIHDSEMPVSYSMGENIVNSTVTAVVDERKSFSDTLASYKAACLYSRDRYDQKQASTSAGVLDSCHKTRGSSNLFQQSSSLMSSICHLLRTLFHL